MPLSKLELKLRVGRGRMFSGEAAEELEFSQSMCDSAVGLQGGR